MTTPQALEAAARAATLHLAGHEIKADSFGGQIWGQSKKGGDAHLLDIRGWGYLTGRGDGALGLSEDEGIEAQRAVQTYAVAAWNAVPSLLSDLAALAAENEKMADALAEAREFVDRYSDVQDGDYGGVEPNEAMQIVHAIDQARAKIDAVIGGAG
jgi:hypothetical protein